MAAADRLEAGYFSNTSCLQLIAYPAPYITYAPGDVCYMPTQSPYGVWARLSGAHIATPG